MQTIKGLENIKRLNKRSIVTIGVFDGVHIGHQKIIKEAANRARKDNLLSVVVTFDPHPLDVLRPKSYPTMLTGLRLKLHLIESLGVEITLVIKFSKSFSSMSASKFVKDILVEKLNVRSVIIGHGFSFGAKAKGDVAFLKTEGAKYGFTVDELPLLKTQDNLKISSTRIRKLLKEGRLNEAKKILGHPVIISGRVAQGFGRGALTGFHTANIETADKASVPKEGVYVGLAKFDHKNRRMPSVINIGPSPTFDVRKKRIEVHVLDYNRVLNDKELEVELIARLRDIRKFKNADALSSQIKKDVDRARSYLKKEVKKLS